MSGSGARKSICAALNAVKEGGRRLSKATKHLTDQAYLATFADSQNFVQCSFLADIDEMALKCDDVAGFHSIAVNFGLSKNFDEVPFKIVDIERQTTAFRAILTSEVFFLETLNGETVFAVTFCNDQSSPTTYRPVGKIKHPGLGNVQLYRISELSQRSHGDEQYVVRKSNEEANVDQQAFMNVTTVRPFLYRLATWFGFSMDSRKFTCRVGDQIIGDIRPNIGWNARNLGYRLRFESSYKNYTVKTVCLATSMLMFLKFAPINFHEIFSGAED